MAIYYFPIPDPESPNNTTATMFARSASFLTSLLVGLLALAHIQLASAGQCDEGFVWPEHAVEQTFTQLNSNTDFRTTLIGVDIVVGVWDSKHAHWTPYIDVFNHNRVPCLTQLRIGGTWYIGPQRAGPDSHCVFVKGNIPWDRVPEGVIVHVACHVG